MCVSVVCKKRAMSFVPSLYIPLEVISNLVGSGSCKMSCGGSAKSGEGIV